MKTKLYGETNVPIEISVAGLAKSPVGPWDREVDIEVSGAEGRSWRVPCFWAGGHNYRARFAAPTPGRYAWRVLEAGGGVEGASGELEIEAYSGTAELYRRGRLRVSKSCRSLEHQDGTPYLWLADTWWMGFTKRLDWPHGFRELGRDRVSKGFNTIQIVAGLLPDYCATEATWRAGQANEGGWPWVERPGRDTTAPPVPADFIHINPAFYDMADLRVAALVGMGLMPCIVGMWGYYINFMGVENAKRHWRNLIARYGAYPVVWCVCGEALMPTYGNRACADPEVLKKLQGQMGTDWSEVTGYVREFDPFGNVTTVQAGGGVFHNRAFLDDDSFDLVWAQTGHSGHYTLRTSLAVIDELAAAKPTKPFLNSEVCYEGIMGGSREEIQRFLFWTHMLSGACGHTYGAQGIWAMNSRDNPFDGTTLNWGDGFWQDVMHYPGSDHLGLAARFLRRYPWQDFQRLQAYPVTDDNADHAMRAGGVPGIVRMHYHPAWSIERGDWPGPDGPNITLNDGERYTRMFFFNPRTGAELPVDMPGDISAGIPAPDPPSREDWVLVLEN